VAALLGFMAVSGIIGWLNIRDLSIVPTLPGEIYAGIDTLLTVRLTNRKRFLPSFLIRFTIRDESSLFPVLPVSLEEHFSCPYRFPVRGMASVGYGEISSVFPVNFFVRRRRISMEERFVVFPAPRPCHAAFGPEGRLRTGTLSAPFKGYEGDVSKIADYTGGEPLKLIHWRLSAKHGALKVKELCGTLREPALIDLAALPGRDPEENLSCAVYLINRLIRGNRPVGLKMGERIIPPASTQAHRLRMLRELALYGTD
jgi:uncharacterized protein (DUF58 family)